MADVVLYDYLASPQLLESARPEAELICLGRHGQGRLMSQRESNDAMIRHASAGRTVVRLKGGDPMIFARGGEEVAALETAGVAYEIVPGITAAQAASSCAGVPLTGRDEASCVAFVTGQESSEKDPQLAPLDYAALARFPGTLVFYMGVTTAPRWSRSLVEHGKPSTTPVAVVRRCSLADQETIFTTLGEVAGELATRKMRPPAVMIVGDVAREAQGRQVSGLSAWFTSRPLFGRTVLVTRPRQQADSVANQLRNLGANVLVQPAIEVSEPHDWSPVDAVIRRLPEFDWLVFSSSNGVEYFMRRLLVLGGDGRALGCTRLAAIGPATVDTLAKYSLKADLQPHEYRAEALAAALGPHVGGKRAFLARASRGRDVLAGMLKAAGAVVEQGIVYETRDVDAPDSAIADALASGEVHWTTVTSSAIARSLVNLFGVALRQTQLAAISPLTAEVLAELGFAPAIIADSYTAEGVVSAILATESGKS
jgi:uroporphyrinogen III methyltransferase/synthase